MQDTKSNSNKQNKRIKGEIEQKPIRKEETKQLKRKWKGFKEGQTKKGEKQQNINHD